MKSNANHYGLLGYQKEFDAAKGFDSEDDDVYFPKRNQPPSPPNKETLKPKERWFERKKPSSQPRPTRFVNNRKDMNVPPPQPKFSTFAAATRQNDRAVPFTLHNPIQDSVESSIQPFPQWDNPPFIHDSFATQNVIAFTTMNPDAPSFQAHGQTDSSLRLNVNAPTFQQSTVSVPPYRLIPPGYGDMTPISGTSPAISRIPSQVSLSNSNPQIGPSVDSLTSAMSNSNMKSGAFNASGHNFDHFSRLNQGSSPPKNSPNAYRSKNTNHRSQTPELANSFKSVPYGTANDDSNCQHFQIPNQARNPHITSLNQRLQAQGQVRERPDRSRTFDRDNRQHVGNRGYGTGYSGMTSSQNSYSQASGSGSQFQSMPTVAAGRGNTKQNLVHNNPMAAFHGGQQNPNISNQLLSHPYSGNNVELGSEKKVRSGKSRARSSSPKKANRPGPPARAAGSSEDAVKSKKSSKVQEQAALKAIMDNFQTKGKNVESFSNFVIQTSQRLAHLKQNNC